jgi:hypothetical protein
MDIPSFFYFESAVQTEEEFKLYFGTEFVYHYAPEILCFNAYFAVEEFNVNWELAMKFQECYKILISCFYDWEEWTGVDSQIMTTCENSSKETVTLWELPYSETTMYAAGDIDSVTRTGENCWPGDLALFPVGPMASSLTKNVFVNMISAFHTADNGVFTVI